jgi:hypothetical protein
MSEMSRGEMIRRLDDVSDLVHDGLATGPLSRSDRDILASRLATLLPVVAQSLQDQEDRQAAHALLPNPAARHEKGTGAPSGCTHAGRGCSAGSRSTMARSRRTVFDRPEGPADASSDPSKPWWEGAELRPPRAT